MPIRLRECRGDSATRLFCSSISTLRRRMTGLPSLNTITLGRDKHQNRRSSSAALTKAWVRFRCSRHDARRSVLNMHAPISFRQNLHAGRGIPSPPRISGHTGKSTAFSPGAPSQGGAGTHTIVTGVQPCETSTIYYRERACFAAPRISLVVSIGRLRRICFLWSRITASRLRGRQQNNCCNRAPLCGALQTANL